MENGMTDKQSERADIYARIDELDQTEKHTTDNETLKYIEARKKELREKLENIR